jgi:hypothetical protein
MLKFHFFSNYLKKILKKSIIFLIILVMKKQDF